MTATGKFIVASSNDPDFTTDKTYHITVSAGAIVASQIENDVPVETVEGEHVDTGIAEPDEVAGPLDPSIAVDEDSTSPATA